MKTKGILVNFMGKLASTTTGPAAFALRTGAVVVPVFDYRQPDGTHVGQIQEAVEIVKTEEWDHDLHKNTTNFNAVIEAHIRARPDLWVWAPDRWRSTYSGIK